MTAADLENAQWTNTDLCAYCYDYASWENTHADYDHNHMVDNDPEREGCWICEGRPDMPPKAAEIAPKAATGAAPHSWSSHAGHDHPATAKARKICRATRAQ